MDRLLQIRDLNTSFFTYAGEVKAVRGVSFDVNKGEAVGLVGESGCGKSVTMLSLLRLLADTGKIKNGKAFFNGKDLVKMDDNEMLRIRGNEISMIFQDPMTSLNPVYTIENQLIEPLLKHKRLSREHAKKRALELLNIVGIPEAEKRLRQYPHEFSGGMRQRVMIAMAMACNPKLLIADEPTTALDVTIQAQILDLMKEIKEKLGTSIMLITHDLGVIAEMADYVVVMYAGKVVEEAPVIELFKNPMHPYTLGLLQSKPILNQNRERLYSIPGQVPNPIGLPNDCHFCTRCSKNIKMCSEKIPPLIDIGNNHKVACWLYQR